MQPDEPLDQCAAYPSFDRNRFEEDGVQVVRDVISSIEISETINAIEQAQHEFGRLRRGGQFAIRRLVEAVPHVTLLARQNVVTRVMRAILGPEARLVRSILFDKTAAANWVVAPHQDTTLAVRARIETPGFGPWSVKAGVPHVQPPATVLERMATIRIHLDDCPEDNGALRAVPGSHRWGLLDDHRLQEVSATGQWITCAVRAGDAVVLRPLIVHASNPAAAPSHRRVVHLEFAGCDLPGGLLWHDLLPDGAAIRSA